MPNMKNSRKLLKRRSISTKGIKILSQCMKSSINFMSNEKGTDTSASSFDKDKESTGSVSKLSEELSDASSEFCMDPVTPSGIKTIVIMNKTRRFMHVQDINKKAKLRRKMENQSSSKNVDYYPLKTSYYNNTMKNCWTQCGPRKSSKNISNLHKIIDEDLKNNPKGCKTRTNRETAAWKSRYSDQTFENMMPDLKSSVKMSKVEFQEMNKPKKVCRDKTNQKHTSISCKVRMSEINKKRCAKTRSSNRFRIRVKKCQNMNDKSDEKGLESDDQTPSTPKKPSGINLFSPKLDKASKAKRWDPYSTKYVFKTPAKKSDQEPKVFSNVKNPVYRAMKEMSLIHVQTPSKPRLNTRSEERRKGISKSYNPSRLNTASKASRLECSASKLSQKSDFKDIYLTREKVGIQYTALNDFLKVGQDQIKNILNEKLYNVPINA